MLQIFSDACARERSHLGNIALISDFPRQSVFVAKTVVVDNGNIAWLRDLSGHCARPTNKAGGTARTFKHGG